MSVGRAAKRRSLERLIVDELDGLYNLALRLTGQSTEAQRLVTHACRNAYSELRRRGSELCSRAWLYRVLWETLVGRNGDGGGQRAVREIHDDSLDIALMSLPCDHRAAFVLCRVEGFSYKEVAWIMGRPRETVMSEIQVAHSRLRERLLREKSTTGHRPASGLTSRPSVARSLGARVIR
jgi:RNA polymerase sigma-70 factor (ECF subfamily)